MATEEQKEYASASINFLSGLMQEFALTLPGPAKYVWLANSYILGLPSTLIDGMNGASDASEYVLQKVINSLTASTIGGVTTTASVPLLAATGLTGPLGGAIAISIGVASAVLAENNLNGFTEAINNWDSGQTRANALGELNDYILGTDFYGDPVREQEFRDYVMNIFDDMSSATSYLAGDYDDSPSSIMARTALALGDLGLQEPSFATNVPCWLPPNDLLHPLPVDPLVIDLGTSGLDLISVADSSVNMDIDGNSYAERIGWAGPSEGVLVIDRNSNGTIDGLADMFGNATTDGFDVLAALDTNSDGKISSADTQFGDLRVWVDANSDGIAQSGEVATLGTYGITEISLSTTASGAVINGSTIGRTASVTTSSNPNYINGLQLEALYGNMFDSMLLQDNAIGGVNKHEDITPAWLTDACIRNIGIDCRVGRG